jgi:hypothetical protein
MASIRTKTTSSRNQASRNEAGSGLSLPEFHPCTGEYRAIRWYRIVVSKTLLPSHRPRIGKTELRHTASLLHIKRREVGHRCTGKNGKVGHRCIVLSRDASSPVAKPARLIYLSVSDSACAPAPSPPPRSSLTHAHRCIGPRDATRSAAKPARLMYLSVSESTGAYTPYTLPSPLDTTLPCST